MHPLEGESRVFPCRHDDDAAKADLRPSDCKARGLRGFWAKMAVAMMIDVRCCKDGEHKTNCFRVEYFGFRVVV